ncbi:hypothetical protein NG798_17010 [Ancylothrix sp. C2]|uniref:hypothetical protein n=1 Tax=Ancylothrix sp. D3o TaxID=2953691 RepID=UPI0021BB8B06|nr:hypothetical protein [Ancylothrix sp. D3o]MCT7951505.1 hypothetical protein [Ancylothrix sp. D3o]
MKTGNRSRVETVSAAPETRRRGSHLNSFLAGIATTLALLLAGGGYWFYRMVQSGSVSSPLVAETQTRNNREVLTPTEPQNDVKQGEFVIPAAGNDARLELLSVRRVAGVPDEVVLEMRVTRLADTLTGNSVINFGEITARHPVTYDVYSPVSGQIPPSGSVSLLNIRRGDSVNGSTVLKVPPSVDKIDIFVENGGAFKNVPVGVAEAVNNVPVTQTQTTTTVKTITPIKPGDFVQKAFGRKGEVELISVKRIQDPETGNRDVVNVQMRVRRLAEDVAGGDIIQVGSSTARNPQTTETFNAVDVVKRSTGSVSLSQIRSGASADAYVWLRVPESVSVLDIYVPETAAFKNVPVGN